ncbi:FtsB family cell division protein [Leuconostoc litchii]|uniref:Septum formation initiator family protein n=1 Tax=Leuconostoc litchii TaxID=1981069 RepID=A0A6P2CNR4_9LACO|nr:septum formation initiator family protein [Leuconostoc litchii]TYC47506.1 septum formation initiator family protein [Leuconostoc litchii]
MAGNLKRRQSNITPLHPAIAREIKDSERSNVKAAKHYRKAHMRREKKILFFGGLIAMIFVVQLLIAQVKLHTANQELTNTQNRLEKVQKTNADLTADTKRLKDATYLQQLLRDKYGYSKQGEIVYNLPSDNN